MKDRLSAGETAPHIIAPTISGELVDTYELSGHKTWFIFYRYANCPLCNLHFDELLSYADFFQKNNVRIVCFFESAKEKFPQRFLDFRSPWIYMVADLDKKYFSKYKVENSWRKVVHYESAFIRFQAALKGYYERNVDGSLDTVPAHFLIWDGLRIAKSHYGRSIANHIPWNVAKSFALLTEDEFKAKYSEEFTTTGIPVMNDDQTQTVEIELED